LITKLTRRERRFLFGENFMHKAFRFAILSAVVSIALVGLSSASASAQSIGPLREILNRMDAHNKSLTSLKADVKMDKFNSQLGETDTTSGATSYLPKTGKHVMYVRIDWTKPVQENIVIIGDQYKLYRPRLNQVIVGRTDRAQKDNKVPGNALAFMSMSKAQLQENYTVNYLGQEAAGGGQTWHLEMIPKMKTSYKSAELWVDSNGMPVQAKIIEQNNDTTTVLLSNLQPNVTINASEFNLVLPKGVKQIQA
jgi:outer membrane lipoprotein-sorting protein